MIYFARGLITLLVVILSPSVEFTLSEAEVLRTTLSVGFLASLGMTTKNKAQIMTV